MSRKLCGNQRSEQYLRLIGMLPGCTYHSHLVFNLYSQHRVFFTVDFLDKGHKSAKCTGVDIHGFLTEVRRAGAYRKNL